MALLKSIKLIHLLLVLMTVNLTATAKNQRGFDLALGTVVDVTSEMLYMSHPEKGIDAISIDTGNVVWHSDDATRPLMIRDGQLISQANAASKGTISLVSFDAINGTVISRKTLAAPSNVLANSSEGLEHKFKIGSNYDNNLLGDIHWSYSYEIAQGIASLQSMTKNTKTNKVYGQINFSQAKILSKSSLLNDATLKILSQKPLSKTKVVTGEFLQLNDGRQFASMSENHVLNSQLNDMSSTWEKYKWNIYDMNDQLLGTFLHYNSYRPFEVIGDTVLFVTSPAMDAEGESVIRYPFMVNAYSLSSGTEKWTREIKDHKYSGPYPH